MKIPKFIYKIRFLSKAKLRAVLFSALLTSLALGVGIGSFLCGG